MGAENLAPTGFESGTIQPVVSCCTDYATWPLPHMKYNAKTNLYDKIVPEVYLLPII
jgi:hypothetical protein